MMKKMFLIIIMLFLTGCSDDNISCIESHIEEYECVVYTYIYSNGVMIPIPHFYSCERTVCDKYENTEVHG